MRGKLAFTLLELMVVVIIVGIIATFAIPNYQKSIDRAYEKDAINNLRLVTAAQQLYFANNSQYFPVSGNTSLSALNTTLKLSILANGFTYVCPTGGASYDCRATRNSTGNPFELKVTTAVQVPCCNVATCPTAAGC